MSVLGDHRDRRCRSDGGQGERGGESDRSDEPTEDRSDGRGEDELPGVLDSECATAPERAGDLRDGGERQPVRRRGQDRRDEQDAHRDRRIRPRGDGQRDHRHDDRYCDDAHRSQSAAHPIGPGSGDDTSEGAEDLGGGDDEAGADLVPAAVGDEPHQGVGPHDVLRNDEQDRREMDAREGHGTPVGIAEHACALGLRPSGSGRIHHADRAGDGCQPAREHGKRECPGDPVVARESRDDECARGDTQRHRHLPDAHREAALVRREPSDHHATARRIGAHGAGSRTHQQQAEQRGGGGAGQVQGGGRARESHRDGRDPESGGQRETFTEPVGDRAPHDEREHAAEDRCAGEGSGLREGEATLLVQGRDEEGDAVDDGGLGGLGEDAEGQDQPSAPTDVRSVHDSHYLRKSYRYMKSRSDSIPAAPGRRSQCARTVRLRTCALVELPARMVSRS